jgi:hypothetical protein
MVRIETLLGLAMMGVLLCLSTALEGAESTTLPVIKPATIEVDISKLPASEQATLVPLLKASRKLDELYMQQVWAGSRALIRQREASQTPAARAELKALNCFKGPWGPTGAPFIEGVPRERPIGEFYPAGSAKQDIDAWLGTLSKDDRERALDPFTAIERRADGSLSAVPYSSRYRDTLKEAATLLRDAAALTHEPTLKNFLTLRAKALLNDDYYASDVAFVNMKGPIDVALAPYEVEDDAWFGVKTAYTSSVALVDEQATQRMARISSHLQELEDHLPLDPKLRGRKLGAAAPIVVLDVIYHGGLAGAMVEAGYGLPNDLRVLDAVGARTGTYSNIMKLSDDEHRAMAGIVLTETDQSALRFEDMRDEPMFVRIFDSLGPQFVTGTKQPIADALQESAGVAAQIRSMLLSLWGHRYLVERGYLDRREAVSIYSSFLIVALSRARGGLDRSPSKGSTYIFNHLLEAKAISLNSAGRLVIDRAAADATIARTTTEFVSLMAQGNAAAIKSLLQRYVLITPAIHDLLPRLGPEPPLLCPVYRTADRLSPPST